MKYGYGDANHSRNRRNKGGRTVPPPADADTSPGENPRHKLPWGDHPSIRASVGHPSTSSTICHRHSLRARPHIRNSALLIINTAPKPVSALTSGVLPSLQIWASLPI
ncbi:hypothetical protein GWI33_014707 [Rhynchophorus ferrugineus]|uniref:Uncharacterized protein n=1 Tax=Rhynchophorus ferrugineus TaxID=354439 RepID=A0A834I0Z3_RHYFE|nr:hypothetical protein GWI33_014707 [Rhynchophorus ferrugineus]